MGLTFQHPLPNCDKVDRAWPGPVDWALCSSRSLPISSKTEAFLPPTGRAGGIIDGQLSAELCADAGGSYLAKAKPCPGAQPAAFNACPGLTTPRSWEGLGDLQRALSRVYHSPPASLVTAWVLLLRTFSLTLSECRSPSSNLLPARLSLRSNLTCNRTSAA